MKLEFIETKYLYTLKTEIYAKLTFKRAEEWQLFPHAILSNFSSIWIHWQYKCWIQLDKRLNTTHTESVVTPRPF